MKRFAVPVSIVVATSLLVTSVCEAAEPKVFGKTADGNTVHEYVLKNKNGMKAVLITRGATLTQLHVPDKDGKLADVVLGWDNVVGYESEDNQYFGCTTGRVCNRIAKGKFTLDGKDYSLAINNEPNHLHGGVKRSLDKVVWKAKSIDTKQGPGIRFNYTSPDGEEGYPGQLRAFVIYVLTDKNRLIIRYSAKTDKVTPVNLTNHSYWNLSGHGSDTVLKHELMLNADKYTPTDDTLIPNGRIESVEGTVLDFRKYHVIGDRIEELTDTAALGYDHNFVLKRGDKKLSLAAKLRDPASGRVLTVLTDQPGIQFYSGNFLKGQTGKGGKTYKHRSAICLETQHYPDSINKPYFPSIVLKPDEKYSHICIYAFSTE